jgi:tetratricopeptide (TPR) repeat protein
LRRSLAFVGTATLVVACVGLWGRAILLAAPPAAPAAPVSRSLTPAPTPPNPRVAAVAAGESEPESRLEVQMLLRAGGFSRLTRLIEAKQARVEEDIRLEGDLVRVLAAFHTADPTLTPFVDAWVAAEPGAYAPLLARAEHRIALAWARRGTKYARDTSPEQFRGMQTFLAGVLQDARAALERSARLGEAYRIMIVAARGLGEPKACVAIADRAIAQLPGTLSVREALAICLLPRWRGSHALVDAIARQSDSEVHKNPGLAALHGFADWDRGRLEAANDDARQHYTRALGSGEHWLFHAARARTYVRQGRYEEALADITRAAGFVPDEPELLMLRAECLAGLGRHAEAAADVRHVGQIDATNPDLAAFRRDEVKSAANEGYQLIQAKDASSARTRLSSAIDLTGGSAELHYWRGRAYLLAEDHTRALADFVTAIRFDARNFESYRNIDFILAKRGDWDGVIRHWTQFLDLEPTNGKAYLERGGAYRQKGDQPAAVADVRKACQLGTQEACDILLRQAAR